MPFLKKAEIQDIKDRYEAGKNKGIIALEKITKGEIIFKCDPVKCMYYPFHSSEYVYTKGDLDKLIQKYPDSRDYIYTYICMYDDNTYRVPNQFRSKVVTEECALFNHSCSPNVGYATEDGTEILAICDIEPGEELTLHYGFFETDNSVYSGLKCKCGSPRCCGILCFNFYKKPEFQDQYYQYCTALVKSKIRDIRPDIKN